jgi:hypothetical protein
MRNHDHDAVEMTLPVAIDARIAGLIRHCWRLGLETTYCCQGDDRQPEGAHPLSGRYTAALAYISFRARWQAILFIGAAGPHAWSRKYRRYDEPYRWTLDIGAVVRFPAADIRGAEDAMSRVGALLPERVGAPDGADDAHRARVGAGTGSPDALPCAPRTCPVCRVPVAGRRRDARYCGRRCQLLARDRRSRP